MEKLCNKFRSSENPVEWRNTAYCLTQMKYTEKIFLKLIENYDGYKDKLLSNPEVKEYFVQIGVNIRKQLVNKPDLKKFLDEYDSKINATNEQEQLNFKQQQLVAGIGSITKKASKAGRRPKNPAAGFPEHSQVDNADMADMSEESKVNTSKNNTKKRKYDEISNTKAPNV